MAIYKLPAIPSGEFPSCRNGRSLRLDEVHILLLANGVDHLVSGRHLERLFVLRCLLRDPRHLDTLCQVQGPRSQSKSSARYLVRPGTERANDEVRLPDRRVPILFGRFVYTLSQLLPK